MIKNSKFLTLLGFLLISPMLFWSSSAQALWVSTPTDVCPAPYLGDSGGQGVSGAYLGNVTTLGDLVPGTVTGNTGCNVLITYNLDGSIDTTNPNAAVSYDAGADDNLVGIINNTNDTITSIFLSSTQDIFGFDGDGICGTNNLGTATPGYTFMEGGPCSNIDDTNLYGGPYVTFFPTNLQSGYGGYVFFGNNGLTSGSSAFFSLEGPVDINLNVGRVPEPMSIALMGLGLIGLGALRKQQRKAM